MELSSFTVFVTEDCNYNCSYCYQKKRKKYIDKFTVEKSLDFFMPFLKEGSYINFYGGEPLLAFDKIQHAVRYIQEINRNKNRWIKYTMSTNGSLINREVLQFLDLYKFSLLLSFDGIAQDMARKKNSFKQIVSVIDRLLENSNIDLETNSVFTPETIGYLSKSIQFIVELGIPNIRISLCQVSSWDPSSLVRFRDELTSLRKFMLSLHQKNRKVPLVHFRKDFSRGIFSCYAGKDRLAITPDGQLWGCHLFLDYFKGKEKKEEYNKYCFGNLNSFIQGHENIYPEILSNYSNLRMSHFYTQDASCISCEEVKECRVCPMGNLFSGSDIRVIPSWICETHKIFRQERKYFWEELEG